jgi:uncharacterized protein YndB with AHSA1/START domain
MGGRGYTIKRVFDAPREVVWEVWTDPEHFAVWFGTERFEVRDVEFDLRPGGEWRATMVMPRTENLWNGVFEEVDPPSHLVMTITDNTGEPGEFEKYTLDLEEHGGKTHMTLSQTGGHLSDEEYERAREGTNSFMDTLEGILPSVLKARHDAI